MFELISQKEKRRVGKLETNHGVLTTPFFMPDATKGFARSLSNDDLKYAGINSLVVNTYHLYLKPGIKNITKAGGIHKFMNWNLPILSDSGGYQVFSLIHKNPKMGEINDDEVVFKSPIDGSTHKLTPEKSIQIQFDLGVDMLVCLDDPPPNDYSKEKIAKAVNRTVAWAKRCMVEYRKQLHLRKIEEKNRPLIFCVVQGGEYLDLRKKCAEELAKIGRSENFNWDGYGFGARHVDEKGNFLEEVLKVTAGYIPENSLRLALGIGTPEDIVKCVLCGWDMFDCVIPTREGRHGRLFLWKRNSKSEIRNSKQMKISEFQNNLKSQILPHPPTPSPGGRGWSRLAGPGEGKSFYETININNEKYKDDFFKVDESCDCYLCQNYSRAYLHHLFASKEPLAMRLASIHNLKFYSELMEKLRQRTL